MKAFMIFPAILSCLALGVEAQGQWIKQTSGTTNLMRSVYCFDADSGLAAGENSSITQPGFVSGSIYKTKDGGSNWPSRYGGPTSTFAIYFVNASVGWAAGYTFDNLRTTSYGSLLSTTNGGVNWVSKGGTSITNGSTLLSVYFFDMNVGWVSGTYGRISKTTDGGTTWISQKVDTVNSRLNSIQFLNANTGWCVGDGGVILATTNGGNTWVLQNSGTGNNLNSIQVLNANNAVIVGNGGLILTRDVGSGNWVQRPAVSLKNLRAVRFVSANTGWAVGDSGTILKTVNGGATWQREASGTSGDLQSVSFANVNDGWVVGTGGTILKYTTSAPIQFVKSNNPRLTLENGRLLYQLPVSCSLQALLFDDRGRLTLKLFEGRQDAGKHSLPLPTGLSGMNIVDFKTDGIHHAVKFYKGN